MIQDIAPHHYHNEYRKRAPQPEDYMLIYEQNSVLATEKEGLLCYPKWKEVLQEDLKEDFTYLFSIDDTAFYLLPEKAAEKAAEELQREGMFRPLPIRIFRTAEPGWLAFAGITGYQLKRWYDSRRYCGHCGHSLRPDEKERMMYCSHCGQIEYPKICPAVIVAVTDQERILLTKYAGREYKRYALIAGFAEIGESIEDTVRREVMEEVGLRVKNIQYYKSQPWSFSDTLLMGFVCELDGDDHIRLDREELSVGEWFVREEVPADGPDISLTREMMWKFKNHEL